MTEEEKRYNLSGQVFRQLTKKITENLRLLYLDFDFVEYRMLLTAYYRAEPTEVELELLDDIATDSNAPIPDFFIDHMYKLINEHKEDEAHDYLIFAYYEGE